MKKNEMTKIGTNLFIDALDEGKEMYSVNSEKLAYWYFRLNGFLTIENFVVHPDWGTQQCTDIDLLAVRFPYRAELLEVPMEDDERLTLDPQRIRIILAEVKTGRRCKLNPAWTNPDKKNIQRMLRAIGSFEYDRVEDVSEKLYKHRAYENKDFVVSLCCLGQKKNKVICEQYPNMLQLTWDEVLSFIYERFKNYQQKCRHDQWDETGKMLWDCAMAFNDFNEFRKAIKIVSKSSHSPDE